MAIHYNQKCARCKKKYVLVSSGQFPVCYDCQKKDLDKPIKDAKMKKMFAIPEDFYRQNSFLRSIKANYLWYGKLSDKQIDAFKKTVKKMKEEKKG